LERLIKFTTKLARFTGGKNRIMTYKPSTRAEVITRRTYNRPLDSEGKIFETWEATVDRVIEHQKWLWVRAKGGKLSPKQLTELEKLRELMYTRKVSTSGRTLWLGGTDVAKNREASQFNCSFTEIQTVYDVVDALWLLLQGCGVGFKPVVGTLNGFFKPIKEFVEIRSTRTDRGFENNVETWDIESKTWTIKIGDSAEAWAKSIGKLLAGKYPADKLVIDYSEIRPAGTRLAGYGWLSSGDNQIQKAYKRIVELMNKRAGSLLTKMDILDILNHLGTILSSRRSAEICVMDYGSQEWREFALAKKNYWEHDNHHRTQSNNSLLFWKKPLKSELEEIFRLMQDAGGSEPGFINAETATKRAPWFFGSNPCVEILLPNKGFCNLVEVDVNKFHGDSAGLLEAIEIASRANYRQTCVSFDDGVLQESWDLNNQFLRLCGVGLTGIAGRPDLSDYDYTSMERTATHGAYTMADELGLQRPKNVTCIKPSGTLSKIMDTTEGIHKPMAKYIFNNVAFGKHDPLVAKLENANYNVFEHPSDNSSVLVTFPVKWDSVEFNTVNGLEVNIESAITQLDRYKMVQNTWCHQNVSNTISYSPEEVPDIIDWLLANWDTYIGVSFLYRSDPTKTAKDLGYQYLPQETVTKEKYEEYVKRLKLVDVYSVSGFDEIEQDACATGACPIK
jgi:adenosylcobalamin-dependent ribonucleoside-triphosphate reductase